MKKTGRQKVAVIAMMLVLAMALGGCGSAALETAQTEEESAVTVSTESVETGTITLTNSFIGTVSPQETVMVIPFAVGTVTETFFEVGDTVEAGDVLFKIDDEAAKLALQQAQLSVESTKNQANSTLHNLYNQQDSTDLQMESSQLQSTSSFEQAQIGYVTAKNAYEAADKAYNDLLKMKDMKDLSGNNIVSAKDLSEAKMGRDQAYQYYLQTRSSYHVAEEALELTEETKDMTEDQLATTIEDTEASLKTGLSLAQLGVAQAQMALDNYTVTAPVSGVIESKGVEVNGIASQSSPAYTIVNNNTMTVTFQVSETVKNTLSVGQKITLERNDDTYTASITEIGASVNLQSGLFQIKACVEANGSQLPSGVSVKVNADTYRAENAMIIPYDAVYYENEGAYVYTSVNGRAVKTPITTGIFDDENIVVTDGLNPGDIVVTSWSPQLTGGVLLRAADTSTPANAENSETKDSEAE
ncbi:MAG: efflux RND transporter periplasmic adaptor subunit [Lachnospiraceae bacterium]|nr:efflux RND transporter periplasmic adaptor subunit [Lachnospiraceae bacterium]